MHKIKIRDGGSQCSISYIKFRNVVHPLIISVIFWHANEGENFKISALKISNIYRPSADPDL